MRTLLQITTALVLLPWPLLVLTCWTTLAEPEWDAKKAPLLVLTLTLTYPSLIFLAYHHFGQSFLSLPSARCLGLSVLVTAVVSVWLGFPRVYSHTLLGIHRYGYSTSGGAVYHAGEVIPGADARSFATLGAPEDHCLYARDARRVYYQGMPLPGAEPSSFQAIAGGPYYRDAHGVFLQGDPIAGADAASFQALDFGFSRDRARVYYGTQPLPDADVQSFRALGSAIAKDKRRIFLGEKPYLEQADAASFSLLDDGTYGRDARHIYVISRAEIIDAAELESFEPLRAGYSKDRQHVYFNDHRLGRTRVIEGADAGSFQVLSEFDPDLATDARDARHTYARGEPES